MEEKKTMKRNIHDVERDINMIELEIREDYNLPSGWYGDWYGSLLEDAYGNNLKQMALYAEEERQYNIILNTIRNNLEAEAKAWERTEIYSLKEAYNGEIVTWEEWDYIAENIVVTAVKNLGTSGFNPSATWYSVEFVDGTDMDIYTKREAEE